ncbi:MAG: LamG domain-containing protein [Kiritimatiellia bacterium]
MCMVNALFLLVLANATPVTAADGRFGQALNGRTNAVEVSHDPAFSHWPLAVGMWVRMLDPEGYSVFLANESKASVAHWELFALQGKVSLYAPGMKPDLVASTADLSDGRWHYLAVALQPDRVRVAMDGKLVADSAVVRPDNLALRQEPLFIGRLSDGQLPAKALLDEVVIRKGPADILATPTKEAVVDADTLACFRFEGDAASIVADAANKDRKAVLLRHNNSAPPVDLPPQPVEDVTAENERVSRLLVETAARLKLGSLQEADRKPRPALLTHWRAWTDPGRIFQGHLECGAGQMK